MNENVYEVLREIRDLLKDLLERSAYGVGERSIFVIPINFFELVMTLIAKERAKGYFILGEIDIPPGYMVSYTIPVTPEHKLVFIEWQALPDPDNVIEMYVYKDGKLWADDKSMVAAIHTFPIRFLRDYDMVISADREVVITFVNPTTDITAKIDFRFAYAEMRADEFKSIVDRYFGVIDAWLI